LISFKGAMPPMVLPGKIFPPGEAELGHSPLENFIDCTMNQSWCQRRSTYRPPAEVIRTCEYEVAEIADDNTAPQLCPGTSLLGHIPGGSLRFGLYHFGHLAGVAVFSHHCGDTVFTNVAGVPRGRRSPASS
jgi:hypothetical protein